MIDLFKQETLRELSNEEYALWSHGLAVIKRVVHAIATMRSFIEVFEYRYSYYVLDYKYKQAYLRYVDPVMPYHDLRDLAEDFLYGISVVRWIKQHYPLEYYPLYLRVFIDYIGEYALTRTNYRYGNFSDHFIDRLNDCLYDIYKEMRNDLNRLELKRVKDLGSYQKRKLNAYIDQLLMHYSRLIAIRVDFGYQEEAEASYELISDHRERLLRYLREQHADNAFVGYIWKLEYGLRKTYHLHTMIFLDGSKIQESISHGKIIGNHWIDKITEGMGTAFNCNAQKEQYKHCGIGRVDYYDTDKISDLKYACRYLYKYDEFLELAHYGYQAECTDDPLIQPIHSELGRVFGTARLPKPKIQLGRPRRK